MIDPLAPEFTIVTSGHGSRFRYDGTDPKNPPEGPQQSLEEAITKAQWLEGYGDTIGLRCMVVHVPTRRVFWPEDTGEVFECHFGEPHYPGSYREQFGLG